MLEQKDMVPGIGLKIIIQCMLRNQMVSVFFPEERCPRLKVYYFSIIHAKYASWISALGFNFMIVELGGSQPPKNLVWGTMNRCES